MKIINDRLFLSDDKPVDFLQSPNQGRKIKPEYVVLHYTAGSNVKSVVDWLCNPTTHTSAHLVIGRDGQITQLVPFNTAAWHAGMSAWDGVTGLNNYSIGIELDNVGRLRRKNDQWVSGLGKEIPNDQVFEAIHKNQSVISGWQTYTDVQLNVLGEVLKALFQSYGLKEILGHDDISPGAKMDSGPALPMEKFRSLVFGKSVGSEPVEERMKGITPYRVFYSYAHEDEEYKDKLEEHLSILRRRGYISEWHDRKIQAGDDWAKEISQNLELADIVLLLISSSFINSEYCWEIEMTRALERHKKGETVVVPIVLRPVLFAGAPFAKLQMLPKDAKPVSNWSNIDEAFLDVAMAISDLVVN